MASLDRRKHCIPIAGNIRPVGVQRMLKACVFQDSLTFGDILTDGDAYAHRHYAQINDHFHGEEVSVASSLSAEGGTAYASKRLAISSLTALGSAGR